MHAKNAFHVLILSCACIFFPSKEDYDADLAAHRNPVLQQVLPALQLAHDSSDSALRTTSSGLLLPPAIVMERGEDLRSWCGYQRTAGELLTAFEGAVRRLHDLHAAGWVHCRLQPGHVLWLPGSGSWRLVGTSKALASGTPQ